MDNAIARIFNERFAHWDLSLPPDALETRQRGYIHGRGWMINYLFGADERGEYLDYYATHRMTNDRHVRIYASGEVVDLEAPVEFYIYRTGSSEEEIQRIREAYFEKNRRIYAMLEEKGLL